MKCLPVVFYAAVACFSCIHFILGLSCGVGEIEDSCPAVCADDSCLTQESAPANCPSPSPCPAPACRCRFNYRRVANGTCLPVENCPAFPCQRENEQYVACFPLCPSEDCSAAQFGGTCPLFGRLGFVVECRPACRCLPEHYRDSVGRCLPAAQCPVTAP